MALAISGLVSGLDSASIVQKLVELEQRPVALIQDKQVKVNDQLLAWQDFNTKLLTLETAVQKINTAAKFSGTTATFTNNDPTAGSIVNLTTTSNAASGTYNFTVNSLAAQHKVQSDQSFASSTANLGLASFSITKGGATTSFSQQTLEDLRNAINASGIGVTASIVNAGGSANPAYKLLMTSSDTGAENAFTVSTAQGQNGLGPNPFNLSFSTTQTGSDASVTLDNSLTVTRASNTINDLLDGVSLNITGTGSGKIVIGSDTATIVKNVQDFATAYNDVMDYAHAQMTYVKDQATKPLFANSTLLSIQQSLRSVVSGQVNGLPSNNGYTTLSQVGITTDISNHLSVDTAVLTQALNTNAGGVRNLFTPQAQGTYSYVLAKGSTVAGTYDTRVNTGVNGQLQMQMKRQGTSDWITMTQTGNYFDGPAGSDLAGFTLRAASIANGDTGTMNISTGVAEQLSYKIGFYTEYSTQGAIYNERASLEKKNSDFAGQIDALNLRIKKKSDDLTAKYARLENTMAQLQGQGNYLAQQLGYYNNANGQKK